MSNSLEIVRKHIAIAEAFISLVGDLCVNQHPWTQEEIAAASADDFSSAGEGIASGRYKYTQAEEELMPVHDVSAEQRYCANKGEVLAHYLFFHGPYFGFMAFTFKQDFTGKLPLLDCFVVDRGGIEETEDPSLFEDVTRKVMLAKTSGKLILAKNQYIWAHHDEE